MIIIEGNLLSEPSIKKNKNEKTFAHLSIISNNFYKEDGKWVNDPTIVGVQCYGKLQEVVLKELKKGEKVIVYGKLKFFMKENGKNKTPYFYILASKIEKFKNGAKIILEKEEDLVHKMEKIPA
jgi:single-stranded DNA-binding protein